MLRHAGQLHTMRFRSFGQSEASTGNAGISHGRHEIMSRARTPAVVLVLVVFVQVGALGSGPQDTKRVNGYATPREAWNAFQQAIADGDFGKAYECLTPSAQEQHLEQCIGGLVMSLAYFSGGDVPVPGVGADRQDGKEVYTQFKKSCDRSREIMEAHGIDAGSLADTFNAAAEKASKENRELTEEEVRGLLLGQLKGDRKKFYVDAMSALAEYSRLVNTINRRLAAGRKHGCNVTEEEATPPRPEVEVLGVKTRGNRAVIVLRSRLSDGMTAMRGSLRIRCSTDTQHFRRIAGRWYLALEGEGPIDAPLRMIEESSLPFQRDFQLDCGDVLRFKLPNDKQLALWCTGAPALGQVFRQAALTIRYGESPYHSAPSKYREMPDGSRVLDGDDSYIRNGGVTTFSDNAARQDRELFVGKYRVLLTEDAGKDGKLSLRLHIRRATLLESLHGDARREYFIEQLKSDSPAKRLEALKLLHEMTSLGDRYAGEPKQMAATVRPLLKDANRAVAEEAFNMLCALGDEQTLLKLLTPAPAKRFRSVYGGDQIAEWNLTPKHGSVCRRVLALFDSGDSEQVALAVGFFTRDGNPMAGKQVLAAVDHKSADVRARVLESLRFYCEPAEIAGILVAKFDDPDDKVAARALHETHRVAMQIKTREVTPYLKHKNPEVRKAACGALLAHGDPEAIDAILEATRDKNEDVRGRAALVLGKNQTPKAFERLVEMLQDPSSRVREEVLNGLRSLNDPRAIPAVKRLLNNEKDERVRAQAKEILGQL
jgi:hypothetical protein